MRAIRRFSAWGLALGFVAESRGGAFCRGQAGALDPAAWQVHRIERIAALNSVSAPGRDPDPRSLAFGSPRARLCGAGSRPADCRPGGPWANIITNGTFHDGGGLVLGSVMRRGRLDYLVGPAAKIYGRGGLAVFEDGSAAICRPGESGLPLDAETLSAFCARGALPMSEFMGGGALLIYRGRKVCSDGKGEADCDATADLYQVQRFDQEGRGLDSSQMRTAHHLIVAEKDGQLHVLWNLRVKSGAMIQRELCEAGFESALKFDGGRGFFARIAGQPAFGSGWNPTGLLISSGD